LTCRPGSPTVSLVHPLTVTFLATCLLLLAAGAVKLRRPAGTSQALRTQGFPSSVALVRLLGGAEVVLAVAALAQVPGAAALVAAAYAAFTGFVLLALLRHRPLSSCGCFGEPDLPPTPAHVVVTGLAAVGALVVALGGRAGVPGLAGAPAPTAAAAVGGAALLCWLAYLVLTALPRLAAAGAPSTSRPTPATATALRSATP